MNLLQQNTPNDFTVYNRLIQLPLQSKAHRADAYDYYVAALA